jgi:hypothetical protein
MSLIVRRTAEEARDMFYRDISLNGFGDLPNQLIVNNARTQIRARGNINQNTVTRLAPIIPSLPNASHQNPEEKKPTELLDLDNDVLLKIFNEVLTCEGNFDTNLYKQCIFINNGLRNVFYELLTKYNDTNKLLLTHSEFFSLLLENLINDQYKEFMIIINSLDNSDEKKNIEYIVNISIPYNPVIFPFKKNIQLKFYYKMLERTNKQFDIGNPEINETILKPHCTVRLEIFKRTDLIFINKIVTKFDFPIIEGDNGINIHRRWSSVITTENREVMFYAGNKQKPQITELPTTRSGEIVLIANPSSIPAISNKIAKTDKTTIEGIYFGRYPKAVHSLKSYLDYLQYYFYYTGDRRIAFFNETDIETLKSANNIECFISIKKSVKTIVEKLLAKTTYLVQRILTHEQNHLLETSIKNLVHMCFNSGLVKFVQKQKDTNDGINKNEEAFWGLNETTPPVLEEQQQQQQQQQQQEIAHLSDTIFTFKEEYLLSTKNMQFIITNYKENHDKRLYLIRFLNYYLADDAPIKTSISVRITTPIIIQIKQEIINNSLSLWCNGQFSQPIFPKDLLINFSVFNEKKLCIDNKILLKYIYKNYSIGIIFKDNQSKIVQKYLMNCLSNNTNNINTYINLWIKNIKNIENLDKLKKSIENYLIIINKKKIDQKKIVNSYNNFKSFYDSKDFYKGFEGLYFFPILHFETNVTKAAATTTPVAEGGKVVKNNYKPNKKYKKYNLKNI